MLLQTGGSWDGERPSRRSPGACAEEEVTEDGVARKGVRMVGGRTQLPGPAPLAAEARAVGTPGQAGPLEALEP